jgi:predicted nucleic acid-binding protein
VVPIVVIGELRAGFLSGGHAERNEQLLQQFLSLPNVQIGNITDVTTRILAGIYVQLRRTGKLIGQNDMLIAALAIEHDASLLTLDTDFSNVPELKLIAL